MIGRALASFGTLITAALLTGFGPSLTRPGRLSRREEEGQTELTSSDERDIAAAQTKRDRKNARRLRER